MSNELDALRRDMLREFEESGRIDTRSWLARCPSLAADIVDLAMLVEGSPREAEIVPVSWHDDSAIATGALRHACTSVLQSTAKAMTPSARSSLGASMARVRSTARTAGGKAPDTFKRAAILAWTVDCLQRRRGSVSRLSTQKAIYFLENALDLSLFVGRFQAMPLGPYDSQSRYKDAEPIAERKEWILVNGTSLGVGKKVEEAARYATRYVRSSGVAAQLLDWLAALSDAELETLATTHAVALDLRQAGRPINYAAIREAISTLPVWKGKLARSNFEEERVESAINRLFSLGLLE